MPIEIREMIIRAIVDESKNNRGEIPEEQVNVNPGSVREEDFLEDMEMVIKMIKNKNER